MTPYEAPVLPVVAALHVYAGTETPGAWAAAWYGLSGVATAAALILRWRYRQ